MAALLLAPPISDNLIGRLSGKYVEGFARLPGLGRCVLTDDGNACYYKDGKILRRPAYTSGRAQYGDIDGDGIDECVAVENGQIMDSYWQSGRFMTLDRTTLPRDRDYGSPTLVPNVDRRRAYLLMFVTPKHEGGYWSHVAIVAYRKVEDRWIKAWERPALPRSLSDCPHWSLASDFRVLVEAAGMELGDHIDTGLLRVEKNGYKLEWVRHQTFIAGKSPLIFFDRSGVSDTGFLAVGTVYAYLDGRAPKKALINGSRPSLSPIATLPNDATAVWVPKPGVRFLIVGHQVYHLNVPTLSK